MCWSRRLRGAVRGGYVRAPRCVTEAAGAAPATATARGDATFGVVVAAVVDVVRPNPPGRPAVSATDRPATSSIDPSAAPTPEAAGSFTHATADFLGVAPARLRDVGLLSGLLVAAAGAAGFSALVAPTLHRRPRDGVAGLYLLDGCHIALHSYPEQELLLLDVLAESGYDARKAIDVFTRRLGARDVRTALRGRG